MMTTPIKASSDSSVATTAACQTPVSLASTSSPMSQASPGHDICDGVVGSSRSDSADSLDHQRKEGQQRLRDLVVTGAESGDIDWKSIIALAEDLHRKEQLLLRSASSTSSSSAAGRGGRRMNISRKQAFFERRRKRKDLARRRKMESVGSFSVNLLYYEADEYRSMKGLQTSNSDKATTNASESSSHNEKCIPNELAGDEKNNELSVRSGSEDELDVFEDDNDVSSLSSNKTLTRAAIRHPVPSTNKPQFIVEGSFMAATSLFNLPKIDDDDEEECSSSSSSNSSTASETYTFGRSYDDDGLITIQEDCSVSTWQHQWKQYSR